MISTSKFNTLTELVATLAKTGSDIGAQVFTLMRHIKHIENYLCKHHKDYPPFEASEDKAIEFIKLLRGENKKNGDKNVISIDD